MAGVFWSLMIFSLIGCVLLAGVVFLRFFLKASTKISGRGLKKCRGKGIRSIAFEPEGEDREYISQYLLISRNGKKLITCKKGERLVSDVDFDVLIFDENNKKIGVLNIVDTVSRNGRTKLFRLPNNTSFVSIRVNKADGFSLHESEADKAKKATRTSIIKYGFSLMVLFFLEGLIVRLCLANIFGGLFKEGYLLWGGSFLFTVALSCLLSLLMTIVVGIIIKYEATEGNRL